MSVGTIIATPDGPSTSAFTFLARAEVRRGGFVKVTTAQGNAYAFVTDLQRTNRYFARADTVWEFGQGEGLSLTFPTQRWEYTLARARFIGTFNGEELERVLIPPSPGDKVLNAEEGELMSLLGFRPDGVELGYLKNHEVPVKLSLTRLLQKHLAILAMSGAGKSNCAQVIAEELLSRSQENGRPAVVLVDVHGEYSGLVEKFPGQTEIIDGKRVRIGVSGLTSDRFREFIPEMSGAQARELQRVLARLKASVHARESGFDLNYVIAELEGVEGVSKSSKQALLGWLHDLQSLRVFDRFDFPQWTKVVAPGKAAILDLSGTISLRKKQTLVAHLARELFYARRREEVPPVVLFLEEAHIFAPTEGAVSKRIVETIAREGRKFHFSLVVVSQRPVRLSTTLLSQAGSSVILRVVNPYDLEHLKRSSEAITSEVAEMISSLPVGEALVVGEAVNYPIFVKIREKHAARTQGLDLEGAAREFEMLRTEMRT